MIRHRIYLLPAALLLAGGLIADTAQRAFAAPKKSDETQARRAAPKPAQVARTIDALMATEWRKAGVKPRKAASDAEFLRRASLDLTGVIPDEVTTRKFLDSREPGKRAKLLQSLIKSDDFNRSMSLRWSYLLVGRDFLYRSRVMKQAKKAQRMRRRMMGGGKDMDEGMMSDDDSEALTLNEWLEKQLKQNVSWGKVAGELISAEGRADKNPATHYMLRHLRQGKAEDVTGSVMKVFQGLQLQCAQCHDDKMEAKFTQRLFYGVAAFFTRTQSRRLPPDGMTYREYRMAQKNSKKRIKPGPFAIVDRPAGQIRIPAAPGEEGRLVLPEYFVTNRVVNPGNNVKRRSELAKMITAKSNPYFAKATVNRMWSFFFGRGIIQPVDAINQTDHVHPKVLELLTEDFKASDYDMTRLTEIMVLTRAYGLSSAGTEDNKEDELALFARAPLRNLSAEQLFYSVLEATGMEDLKKADRRTRRRLARMKYQTLRQFLRTFSEDEDSEELDEGTIPQALLRLNGTLTNDAVRARPGHPVYDRLFRMRKLQKRIDTIYLRVLSRYPTQDESRRLKSFLLKRKKAVEQAQAYSDIFWALLNSSEFNFNH